MSVRTKLGGGTPLGFGSGRSPRRAKGAPRDDRGAKKMLHFVKDDNYRN